MTLGRILLGASLSLAAVPTLAQALSDARFAATTLDVSAHGEAHVPPDMATIGFGVEARAARAAPAQAQASAAMARVIGVLKARGIAAKDIQTSSVSLSPQYVYANGEPPRLTGYVASDQITVRVTDLAGLGAAIDAVVDAGATNVGDVRFGLESPGSAEAFARLDAVKALEDKAAAYASAAGYRIGRLVNLTEPAETGGGPPMMAPQAAARAMARTPIEPGELTVSVDVTGEFELTR